MNEIVHVKCYKERGGCGQTFRVRRKNGVLNRAILMCPCCGDYGPNGRTFNKILKKHVIDVVEPEAPKKAPKEEAKT